MQGLSNTYASTEVGFATYEYLMVVFYKLKGDFVIFAPFTDNAVQANLKAGCRV